MDILLAQIEEKCYSKTLGDVNFITGIMNLYTFPILSDNVFSNLSKGEDRARYLQNEYKLKASSTKEKMEFLARFSVPIHEQKHWHDYVGTTLGQEMFFMSMELISRQMNILVNLGKHKKSIKLPLSKKFYYLAERHYSKEYHDFVLKFNRFMKDKFSYLSNPFDDIQTIEKKAPLLNEIPFYNVDDYLISVENVPITGLTLLEASAVLAEAHAIYDYLGEEPFNLFLQKGYRSTKLWIYTSVITSLIQVRNNMPFELMKGIISNCLIYNKYSKYEKEKIPSYRFSIFLDALKRTDDIPRNYEEIERWILSVINSESWTKPTKIAVQTISEFTSRLENLNKILEEEDREADALELYMKSYFEKTIYFFEKFQNNILYWANDYFFDSGIPRPNIVRINKDSFSKNRITPDETSMTWFFMTDLLSQFFEKNKDEVCCPYKGGSCPIQTENCGRLPIDMKVHPECWFLVASANLYIPELNLE